jgi:hypothetical protein
MTYEQWIETYKPMHNHIAEYDAGFDDTMFETYGDERNFIQELRATAPDTIWTLVTGDNNDWFIISGFHYVNRLGYFVSQVPFTHHMEIDIT